MKINLCGLCGESKWRDYFIEKVDCENVEFFNPVVKNWGWDENAKKEKQNRILSCDYLIYFIAPPMKGFSSIASAVEYSNKFPDKLLFCCVDSYECESFTKHQIESLKVVKDIIKDNGGKIFNSLDEMAEYVRLIGYSNKEN